MPAKKTRIETADEITQELLSSFKEQKNPEIKIKISKEIRDLLSFSQEAEFFEKRKSRKNMIAEE